MRLLSIALLAMAAPLVGAACSSTPPPEAASSPSAAPAASAASPAASEVPRADFAARLAEAICDAGAPCCAVTGAVHDQAYCVAQVTGFLGWKERVDDAKRYDAKSATKCLEDVRALAAKCSAAPNDVLRVESCGRTFGGSAQTGEPCEESGECAASAKGLAFCWQGMSGEEKGRCAVSVPPAKGAACFTPLGKEDKKQLVFSECGEDHALRCDPATNTCGPRLGAGAACEDHQECEEGALCWNHKCKPTAGAACKSGRDCAVRQTCIAGKCGPGKKMGEACGDITDCAEGSCAKNTLRCSSWAGMFLCKAPAG